MFGRGRRERSEEDRSGKQPEEFAGEGQTVGEAGDGGFHVTRRTALVGGAIGGAGLMGLGKLSDASAALAAESAGEQVAVANLETTAEQLHLTFGADPTSEVTVSWTPPGSEPMRAPMLAFSTSPISEENPGELVFLPDPAPFSLAKPRTGPCATSFVDGQSGATTYHYHVPLTGLQADTTYHYAVSDGAGTGAAATASFQTAPAGRASYRFTAFGDQGNNLTSPFTTAGVAEPGDGKGAPLFHLMVGDLAYADGSNPPPVWATWATMVSAAAKSFPWMPVMGNHEVEKGATNVSGEPLASSPTGPPRYNGPYGSGSYFSRFLLPDNGVVNWDGNHLQGSFYSFQIGTVLFVSLAGNDVNFQTSDYSVAKPSQYTGQLAAEPANMALVPTGDTPNKQTLWLEQTLKAAREEGSGVEMIVVQMHFPFASVDTGNSCDLGVRAAWGPLFDKYEVDITLTGHNHNYCRSLPTRGFDPPSAKANSAFTSPFGTYAAGATVDTRRPTVRQTEPIEFEGEQAWDTSLGTVHFVVGGGGAGSTIGETVDASTGLVQAHPFVDPLNNVQAVEDAPWLGFYDTVDAYGYAVFDVDPGDGPGQTSITFQWFPIVEPIGGTTTLPTTPLEKFVFTRMSGQMAPGAPSIEGTVSVGRTVTADPGDWSSSSTALSYQWLLDGTAIAGATSRTYKIDPADQGKELQVRVTGELAGFKATSATSAPALVAARKLQPSAVTASGVFRVGGTVTAAASAWTPPAALTYQWLRDGSPIAGATNVSYSPVAADAGRLLQVKATGTAAGYQSASAVSVPRTVAGARTTSAVSMPTISGTPAVSVAVTAVLADRSQAKDVDYQWLRDGEPIAGATRSSYTPVPADAERALQVEVSSDDVSAVSAAASVQPADFRASRPGFRGAAKVGRSLTAITGSWSPRPKFAYQWLLDGRQIEGATEETLHIKAAYSGKSVSVRITATRTGYSTLATTSNEVAINQGTLKSSTPKIKGRAKVGETLQVERGDWGDHRRFSYLWLVGGRTVAGRTVAGRAVTEKSTGNSYVVRPEDRGKRITVQVSAHAPGFKTVTKTSASTAPVRA